MRRVRDRMRHSNPTQHFSLGISRDVLNVRDFGRRDTCFRGIFDCMINIVIGRVSVVPALNEMLRFHWFVVKLYWLRNLSVLDILGRERHSLVRGIAFIMMSDASCDCYHITLSSTSLVFVTFNHFFSSNNLSILAFVARFDLSH
jgi:hypothetical protein